jgi:hypothetical protein
MRFRLAAAVACCLLAPAVGAQPYTPQPFLPGAPLVATYALAGCASGVPDRATGAVLPQAVCFSGSALFGRTTPYAGYEVFQLVLDLTGTRHPSFTAPFGDANPSAFEVTYRYRRLGDAEPTTGRRFIRWSIDAEGPRRFAAEPFEFLLTAPALVPESFELLTVRSELGYFPANVPPVAVGFPEFLRANLTVTLTPEPSTFALGAAGLIALGAGTVGRRKRREARDTV